MPVDQVFEEFCWQLFEFVRLCDFLHFWENLLTICEIFEHINVVVFGLGALEHRIQNIEAEIKHLIIGEIVLNLEMIDNDEEIVDFGIIFEC